MSNTSRSNDSSSSTIINESCSEQAPDVGERQRLQHAPGRAPLQITSWAASAPGCQLAFAGSQGNLELNVMMPVMARNLLESARLLAASTRLLADRVVQDAEADVDRCRRYAESSPAIVTALNRYLGYEQAASVAKQALAERKTIKEVVLERGHVQDGTLTTEQLDAALDVLAMTRRR